MYVITESLMNAIKTLAQGNTDLQTQIAASNEECQEMKPYNAYTFSNALQAAKDVLIEEHNADPFDSDSDRCYDLITTAIDQVLPVMDCDYIPFLMEYQAEYGQPLSWVECFIDDHESTIMNNIQYFIKSVLQHKLKDFADSTF